MAKNNRGNGLNAMPNHGRGTCPICGRTGAKILWEVKDGDTTIKVCKLCRKRDPQQAKV